MWMPTHVQLTVQKAKGLLVKGKNGTNDCFVVISLGKEKYQTSVKEKAPPNVDWCEECELTIPSQGNTAEIRLQVLHRNFLGVDEFLGQTSIPLVDFDFYERPKNRWYKLHSKPDKKDTKARGELEVRLGFTVKAASASSTELRQADKLRSSLVSLPKVAGSLGGSLASLNHKKKAIKKLASSVGHKVARQASGRRRGSSRGGSEAGSEAGSDLGWDDTASSNADPGVISEGEEDEFGFDDQHGRKATTPDLRGSYDSRHPHRASHVDETPLSSLSSSVQSGLSDTPLAAISERPGQAHLRDVTTAAAGRVDPLDADVVDRQAVSARLGSGRSSGHQRRATPPQPAPRPQSLRMPSEPELAGPPPSHDDLQLAPQAPDPPSQSPTDKRRKESTSKKDKLEKMMSPLKKTPHIFRQLTGKKDKDPMDVFGKDTSGDDVTSGNTVLLLPLSDGREPRVVEGGNERGGVPVEPSRLSRDTLRTFDGRTRDSLVEQVLSLQSELGKIKDELKKSKAQNSDLDEYLDTLLLRVMDTHPDLLQNPLRTAAGVKYAGRVC